MTQDEKRAHARRLIEAHNSDYEFCLVYEDEDLEDLSDEEQREILDLMHEAVLTISWKD